MLAVRPHLFSAAVALSTFSILVAELSLTRVFSVTMYYHFAFLVISLALLGLAIAGAVVYGLPKVFSRERAPFLAAVFMLATAALVPLAVAVALAHPVELKRWSRQIDDLLLVYAASALPFVTSGFAITLAIAHAGPLIGRIYAFDLAGAALGCVAVVPSISMFEAPGSVLAAGAAAAAAALLFFLSDNRGQRAVRRTSVLLAVALGLGLAVLATMESSVHPFGSARNPGKFLGDREILFEKWNAFSQITVAAAGEDDHRWIFIDGDAATRMWSGEVSHRDSEAPRRIPEVRVASLGHALREGGAALVIGPGGGTDILSALHFGAQRVVGVEINPIIVTDVMRGRYAQWTGGLYVDNPRVEVVVAEGRSYLRSTEEKFSVIQATLVDTWAASSSGAFTLSENNLYTVEAFGEFMQRLTANGILVVTRWYDPSNPKEFLRLAAIARAALEKENIDVRDIPRHIIAVADSERRATLMLSPTAFSAADFALLDRRIARDKLQWLAGIGPDNSARGTDRLLRSFLTAPNANDFLRNLPYDATATTDDRPFFFYSLRMRDLWGVLTGHARGQEHNLGVAMLGQLFIITLLATAALVFGPLLLLRRSDLAGKRRQKLRLLSYFACLGFGFILLEIGLMQRFVLFLGHPIYALVVVLAVLLASAGLGSALSGVGVRRFGDVGLIRRAIVAVALLAGLYIFFLPVLFRALLGVELFARIGIAAFSVFCLGLVMGMLLPAGMRVIEREASEISAWAWAVNGATSVLGSVFAVFVSMNFGFSVAFAVGIGIYLLALLPLQRPALQAATTDRNPVD